ncbi:hypothetical protein D9M69_410110 [compost metagenome]
MQVVRAGPDVQGDQRPEVHDGQAIGIHRAPGLLGDEVVHHPEEAGGEEEAHGVVAVPPLHHGVGGARVDRIGLEPAHRDGQVVDHVEHGGDQDEGAEEPVAHVDVPGLALDDGAEEDRPIGDPDDGHPHRAGEFHLGVFLGGGQALGQGDQQDHHQRLPAPEGEGGKPAPIEPRLAGALHRVVAGGEQRAAAEGEDHQVGVQRAQAAEAGPGQVEVQLRPDELGGDEHPHTHADYAPDNGHQDELADHLVVVGRFRDCAVHVRAFRLETERSPFWKASRKGNRLRSRHFFMLRS